MILGVFAGPTLEDIGYWMSLTTRPYPGVYDITHTFARAGQYRLWLEIADNTTNEHHAKHATLIAFTDLTVGEGTVPVSDQQKKGDTYSMVLRPSSPKSGEASSLTLTLRNPEGKAVRFMKEEPFMYILVSEDHSFYLLDHGTATANLLTGMIPVTFPKSGTYYLMTHANFFDADGVRSADMRSVIDVK